MASDLFIVDASGHFAPGQVRIIWRDEARPPHPELDALIAETWTQQCEASRGEGTLLFNGQLVRHLGHKVENGVLAIDAGPTDYRDFLGTNLSNYDRAEEFGRELFSNAIGTSATVISNDGWLVYGVRGQQVASHRGYVHAFGGMLEAGDLGPDGSVDAFGSILREVEEELRLGLTEVESIICLGLLRDPQIHQPELVFDIQVRCSRFEMAKRIVPSEPQQEHVGIAACRDEPQALVPFIQSCRRITPIAIGALFLHGRRCFGDGWHSSCRLILSGD